MEKVKIITVVFVLLVYIENAYSRRKSRSMLKIEHLKTSKEFLMKFINDYNPQRQFCRGKFIKHVVSHPGCISKPIINKMCYGMCKSAYIPDDRKDKKSRGSLCVQCQPASMVWTTVSLKCPSLQQKLVVKKVRKIRKCHCWSDKFQFPMMMIPDSKSVMKVMAWLKHFKPFKIWRAWQKILLTHPFMKMVRS